MSFISQSCDRSRTRAWTSSLRLTEFVCSPLQNAKSNLFRPETLHRWTVYRLPSFCHNTTSSRPYYTLSIHDQLYFPPASSCKTRTWSVEVCAKSSTRSVFNCEWKSKEPSPSLCSRCVENQDWPWAFLITINTKTFALTRLERFYRREYNYCK